MPVKIKEILRQNRLSISFEYFPPKTPEGENQLLDTVQSLNAYQPSFVSVTYGAGGSTREGTQRLVRLLKKGTGLNIMPHQTCVGTNKEDIRAILQNYKDLGIENLLALRGDLPEGATEIPSDADFRYAVDLIRYAASWNQFSIGMSLYPEGHIHCKNLEEDIRFALMKAEAGADFGITQMFFDNDHLYRFMEKTEKAGLNLPVVCGIMPVLQFESIQRFSRLSNTSIPKRLEEGMTKAATLEDQRKFSLEYATEQVLDLMAHGFKNFHIYTLNKPELTKALLTNLGL